MRDSDHVQIHVRIYGLELAANAKGKAFISLISNAMLIKYGLLMNHKCGANLLSAKWTKFLSRRIQKELRSLNSTHIEH